jgi:hypothetical protein
MGVSPVISAELLDRSNGSVPRAGSFTRNFDGDILGDALARFRCFPFNRWRAASWNAVRENVLFRFECQLARSFGSSVDDREPTHLARAIRATGERVNTFMRP